MVTMHVKKTICLFFNEIHIFFSMFNASNAFHVLCYFQAYAIECHISNCKSDRELRIAC